MKKYLLLGFLMIFSTGAGFSQPKTRLDVPLMPDPGARIAQLERQWKALQQNPPQLGVRDCYAFILDALDTGFLNSEQIEWALKLMKTRVITDPQARSYGNIYWGWNETGGDMGDGNNVQFCVQYGISIKLLFNDRLSPNAVKTLDEIFAFALSGVRNQNVRISYTNIYLMKILNFSLLGQVYNLPSVVEEGRRCFDTWLNHVASYGNREYDSPTYCGVDLESLLLLHRFTSDAGLKAKATDALDFLLTDLCSHYNLRGGYLGGAHSRDYNRVFGRDLLEEKYMNPLLGGANNNVRLFNQLCLDELQKIGLTAQQKEIMKRKNRYIVQRWDSLVNTYACDFAGDKVSIASSNQAYSPDDKPFVIYLSSAKIPEMPNIAFVMEGRDDHYGTWGYEGKGEKLKHMMPPNYPASGGWGKTRHLMPFMQSAQNKGEFVMLVAGEKDHNCINNYLNSTILLPNYLDEIWIGNSRTSLPEVGGKVALDESNTLFVRFEDVAISFRILWDNADNGVRAYLFNDGFKYESKREAFQLRNNEAIRLTLQHPDNGKAQIAMWWKVEEGIHNEADFSEFRQKVLKEPVSVEVDQGIADIYVKTPGGKLGVKADVLNKKRLDYYLPVPLPKDFLFNVDGVEIGIPVMGKYKK